MYGSGEFRRSAYCSNSPGSDCPKPINHAVGCETEGTEFAACWCKARLDPEGGLSSFPAVLTTFIGIYFGGGQERARSLLDLLG